MSKPAKFYYAAAVGHRESPGDYLATFAIAGQVPEWVTESGRPKVFPTKEAAELAGFQILVARLNRAQGVQTFMPKRSQKQPLVYRAPPPAKSERDQVFRRFK